MGWHAVVAFRQAVCCVHIRPYKTFLLLILSFQHILATEKMWSAERGVERNPRHFLEMDRKVHRPLSHVWCTEVPHLYTTPHICARTSNVGHVCMYVRIFAMRPPLYCPFSLCLRVWPCQLEEERSAYRSELYRQARSKCVEAQMEREQGLQKEKEVRQLCVGGGEILNCVIPVR